MRLARPEDGARFGELLALATEDIEKEHVDEVEAGRCGAWLLEALQLAATP